MEQNGTFKVPHFRNMLMSQTYNPIASFKAEIWHKLEESVSKQSGSIALHKSFSQGKYGTQLCLFVLANQMQASKTQIFSYLWHLLFFSNAFFKAQMWQKAEEYVPKKVCQHTSAQVIFTGKIRRVLYVNFEFLFWPMKCMHFKTKIWETL